MDMVMLSIIILCVMAAAFYYAIAVVEKKFANWMD